MAALSACGGTEAHDESGLALDVQNTAKPVFVVADQIAWRAGLDRQRAIQLTVTAVLVAGHLPASLLRCGCCGPPRPLR
jgi:hypothetical protein